MLVHENKQEAETTSILALVIESLQKYWYIKIGQKSYLRSQVMMQNKKTAISFLIFEF